ncbi:hypothetical protein M9458_052010 [Cirrhinus mrigala]|uniref:Uncharacterized protein n=1 Tax=Cirrhinus mrigala TaxID=683832 RepID=A0ABD0MT20_CIRMR
MGETRAPNIRRRTTAGTTAAPTQKRAEEGPEGDHPAATMQTEAEFKTHKNGHSTHNHTPHLHHYPQRGNQRQTPELNPLHSGVETGRPPRSPAAAEKTTSPDPDRMASSTENRGVKKKKEDPMPHLTHSNVVLVCVVLKCFKTGEGQDTNHPPPARVKSASPRALNVYVRLNEQTAPWMPFSVPTPKALYVCVMRQRSTTSPASQRHTRTPKPYLYVGVMERGSIRDGEEIIGGGRAPPLPQICPGQGAQGRGPRPIQTRAHGSLGRPTRPHSRGKNYPHPIIQSTPRLQKAIDTQVKSVLRHQPTLPAAHQPGPKDPSPPGPAGIPSSAACSRQKNNTQEPPTPHPGQDHSPSAEPPKKPTPRELPDAPSPYGPPTATTKTKAGQNRDPPPTLCDRLIKGAQRD